MLYTNIDAVMRLIADSDIDAMTHKDREHMRGMINAYWTAYYTPPRGVIGVGAISYAEQALIDYQLSVCDIDLSN